MDFYGAMANTQNNISVTENGAIGYKTTGKELTDLFFKVSSLRNRDDSIVMSEVTNLLKSGEPNSIKFLFYVRDIREGLGERRFFRLAMKSLLKESFENKDAIIKDIITKHIPSFGRYDDLFVFLDTVYEKIVIDFIKETLTSDIKNMKENKGITLLSKWMPSVNTSSYKTRIMARKLAEELDMDEKTYRKTLASLRSYLKVVETQMCARDWDSIDYNAVPSLANLHYANAFLAHDETRRRQYLADLNRGVDNDGNVVKMNGSVNFPHDIVHKYMQNASTSFYSTTWGEVNYDESIEQLWKNLKEVEGLKDTIVVRDDSGSMGYYRVANTNVTPYEVATALGIYCAEHLNKSYKNKLITFSHTARYLDFSDEHKFGSLKSKLNYLNKHVEAANTNLESVFDLILNTAIENNLSQDDMPKQILILSDMEFDCGITYSSMSLFRTIEDKYLRHGYKLPKLVYWNLLGRTDTLPCKQNDLGVTLVSGFSQNVLNLVNNGEMDPYKAIVKELTKERYKDISEFKIIKK